MQTARISVLAVGCAIFLFAASAMIGLQLSFGQEVSPDPAATGSGVSPTTELEQSEFSAVEQQIFQQSPQAERIAELSALQKAQIESYRVRERDYQLKKTQYYQLQTLQSLEEAVQATRAVMVTRSEVLITYLELLGVTLEDTPGINLPQKQILGDELVQQIQTLRAHLEQVKTSEDRLALQDRVVEFEILEPKVSSIAYKTMSAISLGKIQTAYDISKLIQSDLEAQQQNEETSQLRQAERERAHDETKRTLTTVKAELEAINQELAEELDEEDDIVGRTFYSRTLEDLQPIYAQLSQITAFLEELLTI